MRKVLITGATGNIGQEVIPYLCDMNNDDEVIAAVSNTGASEDKFPGKPNLKFRYFDFEDQSSFPSAFNKIDILFLLRPPHILLRER